MRYIRDIHADKQVTGQPTISFEFFPFKTPQGEATFFGKTLPALMTAKPDYASVTYGAGGSTREKTLEIVERIQCAAACEELDRLVWDRLERMEGVGAA